MHHLELQMADAEHRQRTTEMEEQIRQLQVVTVFNSGTSCYTLYRTSE